MTSHPSDTIVAIATPPGKGGVGIVRISGPGSRRIAETIFRSPPPAAAFPPLEARKLFYGHILDPESNTVLDEVLIVSMPGPHSYTCEDVVEIQAHAGRAGLEAIMALVLRLGARLAEPGEFTRRAFLGGRIDLSRAEAVMDLVSAKTKEGLLLATRNLRGEMYAAVLRIQDALLEIRSLLEADIEFPEEVEGLPNTAVLAERIVSGALRPIHDILAGYEKGRILAEGLRLVILGRTNVGKSSLMNRLLKQERAIVTDHPGTTRDSIEAELQIRGVPVVLVDTAGLRETPDPVERIGIERTKAMLADADLVLFMVDAATGILPEDREIYALIQDKERILLLNKRDLVDPLLQTELPEDWSFRDTLPVSIKFGLGIEDVFRSIYDAAMDRGESREGIPHPNLRQKGLFEKAAAALSRGRDGLLAAVPPELISMDMQQGLDALDEITGSTVKIDILDSIFNRFCIGK